MHYDVNTSLNDLTTKCKDRINVLEAEIRERRDKLWLDGLEAIVASVEDVSRVETLKTDLVKKELDELVSEKRRWEQVLDAVNHFKKNRLTLPDVMRRIKELDDEVRKLSEPHD